MTRSLLTLSDGRALDVEALGPDEGLPLVFHHGTPGGAVPLSPLLNAANELGLRTVIAARPGYSSSTRQPERRVVDAAPDTAELLDWLGAEDCVVAGWSGGGPHALACGAKLPDRVRSVLIIAGVAPFGAPGLNWFGGMGEGNLQEFGATLVSEAMLRDLLEPHEADLRVINGTDLIDELSTLLSPADRDALTAGMATDLAAGMRDGLANGIDGWVDDDLAFVRPWGFDLDQVRVPVQIWHGEEDLMVPVSHGRWLADRLPTATLHFEHEHGHLSITREFAQPMVKEIAQSA